MRKHLTVGVGKAGLVGELRGGIAGAMVGLGVVLPLGTLAFAALGHDAAAIGVRAAFTTAIFGGLVAALIGGAIIPGSIPRTATTLIYASFVATLVADPALKTAGVLELETIFALCMLCVVGAGMLQVVFGMARLGTLIKFVPLPVVAGFMDGVAILIVISQIGPLLGLQELRWDRQLIERLPEISFLGMVVGIATAAFAMILVRRRVRFPWSLAGFLFGAVIYHAIRLVAPEADLGPVLGAPAAGLPEPVLLHWLAAPEAMTMLYAHLPQLAASAFVIALIGSMDSLLAAVSMDTVLHTRHRANRMLIGQGFANIAVGAIGGVPVAYSMVIPLSVYRAGGRGILAGCVMIATLLLILLFGGFLIGLIPVTVSAGVMLIVALGLFDQWSVGALRQLRADRGYREAKWSLAVVLLVCLATLIFGFLVAIVVGVFLSFMLFIVAMNSSLVRSFGTGATRSSRRIYFPDQEKVLRERGDRIKFIELQGAIFFGTAERLALQVDALAKDARFIILDVKRVTTVDASGAMALERMAHQLQEAGVTLLVSGIVAGDRHARALDAFGVFEHRDRRQWFADADRALEHAERELLDGAGIDSPDVEMAFEDLSLLHDLSAEQRDRLRRSVVRAELAADEVLFSKGETGDRLYVLARGSVSIFSGTAGEAGVQRLASFAPGVIFGETAMLDGGGRTATGVADRPSVVYILTRDALDEIRRNDPMLATQVLLNLARQLSARLRFATGTIQSADY